jgi:hypothetical protein
MKTANGHDRRPTRWSLYLAQKEKLVGPAENRTPIIQPVVSHSTDLTILTLNLIQVPHGAEQTPYVGAPLYTWKLPIRQLGTHPAQFALQYYCSSCRCNTFQPSANSNLRRTTWCIKWRLDLNQHDAAHGDSLVSSMSKLRALQIAQQSENCLSWRSVALHIRSSRN